MNDICLAKGDTGIGIIATLTSDSEPIDLDKAEVRFLFGDHELYPKKEGEVGKVMLTFEEIHTKVTGHFRGVFKIKFKDGRIETFPSACQGKIKMQIKE